jgi:hypothetical protein
LVAHGVGPTAKALGHSTQGRRDGIGYPISGLADPIDCLRGILRRVSPDPLEVLLQRPQTPLDFANIGRDCARAGMSRSLKHGWASLKSD